MSHHRKTVTAEGAPEAVGPYTHAVVSNGLVFCSGQVPLDPNTGKLVEGTIGEQTKRCLENLSVVAAAAGAQLSDAVRMGIYVDGHGHVQGRQRGLRHLLRDRPAGALDDRRLGAPARARRSRSMPSSPSPTERPTSPPPTWRRCGPAVEELARRTPMLSSRTLSERAGGVVALKAENLQRTGSFKVRGVAAKLASLGEEGCRNGVVAASAGNHAQALAAAARVRGVHCEVFVPSRRAAGQGRGRARAWARRSTSAASPSTSA